MASNKQGKIQQRFGVYTGATGSYTMGEHRFTSSEVVPVPVEVAEAACPDTSPVRFFDTKEEAQAELEKLKAAR